LLVKTLEFDKVKEFWWQPRLVPVWVKNILQNLQVSSDFAVVKKWQEETAEVMSISWKTAKVCLWWRV
jgi:hypothetical protein